MFDREKAIAELMNAIKNEVEDMSDFDLMRELDDRDISYLFGETE